MKKLSTFLNTPAGVVITVGLIVLVGEFSIMLLIEGTFSLIVKDRVPYTFWKFIDPIVLTALVSPALYILMFRPMHNQQADELRRKEQLTALIEAIPDAVFLKDGEGRWLITNEQAKQLFQLHDLPWQGKTEMELADLHPAFRAAHEGCLAGDEKAWQAGQLLVGEESVVGKDGRCAIMETRKVPLFSKEGQRKGLVVIGRDITERLRMEQEAHDAHRRLRELSAHLQTVREEEKAHIAREIHDDLGGTLTALKMDMYWLARKLPPDKESIPLLELAETMSQLIDNAVGVTRRIITELRPSILDDLGLLAAIEWQAAQCHKRTGIECRVSCAEDKGQLDKGRSIALFRIFQEALTNVMRHSGASSVDIEFRHSDTEVLLRISDNGRGLGAENSDAAPRYGIRGMFERASSLGGHVDIYCPLNGGLTVTAILPLQNEPVEENP